MIDIAKGRYWDLPWSLIDGCTPSSPGCDHCWSASMAHRYRRGVHYPDGRVDMSVTNFTDPDGHFDGRIKVNAERLSIPLKRRKPTVFAAWNDLFHEAVPVNFLEEALATITLCPQHTFLILTKRAQRLNLMTQDRLRVSRTDTWPIKNLWLGITVCNQAEADEKIPVFLQVPGKKFLSIEPLLGAVDLRTFNTRPFPPYGFQSDNALQHPCQIGAVILGGETGPGARPMRPDWVRSVRDQCAAAGVPFFFKGWGKHIPDDLFDIFGDVGKEVPPLDVFILARQRRRIDGRTHDELPWRVAC